MVCKCVWLATAALIVILHCNLTKQHYIPPTDFCAFAKVCNHTGVPLCGIEKKNESSRLFLDECDLYEYNCDNHKDYTKTNIEKCTSNTTVTRSTKPSTILVSGIEINDAMANVSKTVNKTGFSMKTTPETVSTTNYSSNVTCVCPTVICPNITISITSSSDNNSTISSINTTVSSINTTPFINGTEETSVANTKGINVLTNTTTSIEAIANYTSTEAMTQITSAKAVTNLTVTEATTELTTTQETTINVTATLVLTSNSTVTTFNVTCTSNPTSTREEFNTLSVPISESTSTTYKITPTTKLAKNTTSKEEIKTSQVKCEYPKHCNRPKTWKTTAKGETRDFYQILRAQFGDRVKLLRDTTHFSRHIATDFSNDDGFQFGYHNEKTNEIEK